MNADYDKKLHMLQSSARILSDNYGVRVLFSKSGCCHTSEKIMTLPYNDLMDEAIIMSFMMHEAGHLRFTDMKYLSIIIAKLKNIENRHVLFSITNAIEDVRIEVLMEKEYPGCSELFNYSINCILKRRFNNRSISLVWMLMSILFLRLRNFSCDAFPAETVQFVNDKLFETASAVHKAENSFDSLTIAVKLYRILEKIRLTKNLPLPKNCTFDFVDYSSTANLVSNIATAPSAPPKSELERAANERKERELLRASGVDLEEFKDNDYLEGFDDTIKAENAEVNSTNQRKYDGFSKCKGKSYYTPSNDLIGDLNRVYEDTELIKREFVFKSEVKEMLQEAYEKATSIQVSEIKYNPQEYSIHPLFDVTDKETEFEIHPSIKDAGKYSIVSEMIRPIYKIIQNNLARYICDESAAKWSGSLCSGRKLDRKMLPRIPFGEMRFFRDRTKKNARNIVFELVVDLSGSMYGKKIEEARSAAVLFGEVLNSLHIPFEIIGYTSGKRNLNHKISSTDIAIQKCISYNRTDGLVHVMFKRFDESYDNVKYKLMSMNAHGGNYDQDSMEFVWNRIRKRSEKKKVILWLTDSETNGGIEARFKLKKMINKIGQTADSEIIGIGFLSDYVADFYHKYVIVERVEDLGLNIVRLIKSAIYDTKIKTQHARAVA